MSAWRFVASAGAAELEVVWSATPLAVELMLECGPVRVPIGVAAAEATLEQQDDEPARVLRSFLRDNPWEGMGSVTAGGWMLLAEGLETMVFGQRHGPLGLGSVVTMSRRDVSGELGDRFRARNMGGARTVLRSGRDGLDQDAGHPHRPEPAFRACVDARSPAVVRVWWDCGQDLDGVVQRVLARTELVETAQQVHFLLISAPNPDYQPAPPGFLEVGTGCATEALFELAASLGDRELLSDYSVPATQVHVHYDGAP